MTPTHLNSCPNCETSDPRWQHNGFQAWPARYVELRPDGAIARRVASGAYRYSPDGTEVGADLYTCSGCGSTASDEPR